MFQRQNQNNQNIQNKKKNTNEQTQQNQKIGIIGTNGTNIKSNSQIQPPITRNQNNNISQQRFLQNKKFYPTVSRQILTKRTIPPPSLQSNSVNIRGKNLFVFNRKENTIVQNIPEQKIIPKQEEIKPRVILPNKVFKRKDNPINGLNSDTILIDKNVKNIGKEIPFSEIHSMDKFINEKINNLSLNLQEIKQEYIENKKEEEKEEKEISNTVENVVNFVFKDLKDE